MALLYSVHTRHPLTPTVSGLPTGDRTAALYKTRDKDNVEEEEQDPRHGHAHNDDERDLPLHLQHRFDGPRLAARRRAAWNKEKRVRG